MGVQSQLAVVMDELRDAAGDIAASTGAVTRCALHSDVLINNFDDEGLTGAYKLANHKVSRGEVDLPLGLTRRDLTDAIKDVVENSELQCPRCQKLMSE